MFAGADFLRRQIVIINIRNFIMKFIETLINGLSVGSTYAMIALGYTMVYGIAKMLNFAHGDIIMVGGYTIFVTMSARGNPILGLAAAVVFCMLLGITIE